MNKRVSSSKHRVLLAALFFWTTSVLAHRPISSDLAANDPNTAILVDRPVVSQVIYRPLDADHRQIWLAFEARAGFDLFIELVVSVLDRLQNYRPSMAVVGSGLEQTDIPFSFQEHVLQYDANPPRFGYNALVLEGQPILELPLKLPLKRVSRQ